MTIFEIKSCVLSERMDRGDREIFLVGRKDMGDLLVSRVSSFLSEAILVNIQTYRRTWAELGHYYHENGQLVICDYTEFPFHRTWEDISFGEIAVLLLENAVNREKLGSLLAG